VFLAGLRFGPVGALVAGVTATFVAGPLLPADSATGVPQAMSDWVSRGIFFVLIGEFVTYLFGAVRRTSTRAAQAEALREGEQRFRALVQRATDMIVVVDAGGAIKYESPAVERILGWAPGERLGMAAIEFVHLEDREMAQTAGVEVFADPGTSRTIELRRRDAAGSWHWVESTVTNLIDEPTVRGLVVNDRVVDERKALEDQLIQRAFHDTLTGLANRGLLRERLESALARRDRSVRRPSLLFIDLDDFKTVNDGFGHDAGDRLLTEVATRLRASVRPEDLVARLGGDEFAVLIDEVADDRDAANHIAQRIIDVLQAPFDVSGHRAHVRASIGIASYQGGVPDADVVLMQADIAMYNAKANGKDQYVNFSEKMQQGVRHRLEIEAGLRAALDHDEIRVLYQPIVALATGEIEAVEALVRWQHPTRGLLAPAAFLDVAEETGLIVPIGRLVLNAACAEVRRWRDTWQSDLKVSVNLAAAQLRSAGVVNDVCEALETGGVDADALILEVTEGRLIEDVAAATTALEALRAFGVAIAIDDFGTGYSSLSHLQRFPVDIIKVDRAFVDGVCRGTDEATLVRSVLAIGGEFRLKVVAEGIESADQDEELRRLGCGYGQGYLYARPGDPAAIDALLAAAGGGLHVPVLATGQARP